MYIIIITADIICACVHDPSSVMYKTSARASVDIVNVFVNIWHVYTGSLHQYNVRVQCMCVYYARCWEKHLRNMF